ncbi:MAG: IS200/IS605 family transposase [Acidobacteriota bacterium]|nr:IS200/IS605 family transposase [Acidobacteriota bacterium]
MANTYSSLFYHLVFSTKNRKYFLKPDKENRIWDYLSGIARNIGATPIQVGGIEDHIHALLRAKPVHSPSVLMNQIKGSSSHWIKNEFSDLFSFGWQDGYSVFSVSKSNVAAVVSYIKNQREHHSNLSFEDEYRRILSLHDIDEVDDRFLFG